MKTLSLALILFITNGATAVEEKNNPNNKEDVKIEVVIEKNMDVFSTASKAELLALLREDIKTAKETNADPSVVTVPLGPDDESQLFPLESFSEEELKTFLNRKQSSLNRLQKTLTFFRLKPSYINKVLHDTNARFYNSSRVITHSNSVGGTLTFSISGGLALPQKIMEKIKQTRIGKMLPEKGGFYIMFAPGIGLSKALHPDGKTRWTLDIFHDFESLENTMTGILDLTVAVNPGYVREYREGDFAKQTANTLHGGPLGVFRQGANQFGWTGSLGIGVPPFLATVLVYQDRATRYYWLRASSAGIEFPALKLFMNWLSQKMRPKTSAAGLCARALL